MVLFIPADARDDFYTTVVHLFDKLNQVLRALDFHGQNTSARNKCGVPQKFRVLIIA